MEYANFTVWLENKGKVEENKKKVKVDVLSNNKIKKTGREQAKE